MRIIKEGVKMMVQVGVGYMKKEDEGDEEDKDVREENE